MKTYLLLTAGVVLSSPLVLAQAPTPPAPSSPPPEMPVTPDKPDAEQHKPDANSQSGSVREDRSSVGANGNSQPQSAKGRLRSSSHANDFAMWDVDGDGKLTKDEAKGHADVEANFKAADKDGNGSLSRREYEKSFDVKSPKSPDGDPTQMPPK